MNVLDWVTDFILIDTMLIISRGEHYGFLRESHACVVDCHSWLSDYQPDMCDCFLLVSFFMPLCLTS